MKAQVQTSPTGDERVKVWPGIHVILDSAECNFRPKILHPEKVRKVKDVHHILHRPEDSKSSSAI